MFSLTRVTGLLLSSPLWGAAVCGRRRGQPADGFPSCPPPRLTYTLWRAGRTPDGNASPQPGLGRAAAAPGPAEQAAAALHGSGRAHTSAVAPCPRRLTARLGSPATAPAWGGAAAAAWGRRGAGRLSWKQGTARGCCGGGPGRRAGPTEGAPRHRRASEPRLLPLLVCAGATCHPGLGWAFSSYFTSVILPGKLPQPNTTLSKNGGGREGRKGKKKIEKLFPLMLQLLENTADKFLKYNCNISSLEEARPGT